ncbi:hypothetical protein ACLOJK_000208 [Asimina triloba]
MRATDLLYWISEKMMLLVHLEMGSCDLPPWPNLETAKFWCQSDEIVEASLAFEDDAVVDGLPVVDVFFRDGLLPLRFEKDGDVLPIVAVGSRSWKGDVVAPWRRCCHRAASAAWDGDDEVVAVMGCSLDMREMGYSRDRSRISSSSPTCWTA